MLETNFQNVTVTPLLANICRMKALFMAFFIYKLYTCDKEDAGFFKEVTTIMTGVAIIGPLHGQFIAPILDPGFPAVTEAHFAPTCIMMAAVALHWYAVLK